MKILALSGGGFRATLFHLGVIRHLFEKGKLADVDVICSVSGGSVLAAHLVLNWERYLEKNQTGTFPEAAKEIVDFVQNGMTRRIFCWWFFLRFTFLVILPTLFIWWAIAFLLLYWVLAGFSLFLGIWLGWFVRRWSREELLIWNYEKLYKNAKLEELKNQSTHRPKLYLLSTNLISGDLCAFSDDGFHWWGHTPERFDRGNVTVARAVAASSAFPPAFPPVRVTKKMINNDSFPKIVLLTDGGVYDNSGVQGAKILSEKSKTGATTEVKEVEPTATKKEELEPKEGTGNKKRVKEIIVSISEKVFDPDETGFNSYRCLLFRSTRASDLVMNRVGAAQESEAEKFAENSLIVRLSDELPQDNLPSHVRGPVRKIRTDFNSFSKAEIQLLVYYGYFGFIFAEEKKRARDNPSTLPQPQELGFKLNGKNKTMPCVDSNHKDNKGVDPDHKEKKGRWLPFSENEVSNIDAENQLKRSQKTGWDALYWPFIIGIVMIILIGGGPLVFRQLTYVPGNPTALAFENVFQNTDGGEFEKKLIKEVGRDIVLEKFMASLPDQEPSPPSLRFFAYTDPLETYCEGELPTSFNCRVWCKGNNVKMTLCLFLRRDTEYGPRFDIVPPVSNETAAASFTFSGIEAKTGQKIIAIGRIDFPDGQTKANRLGLKEIIHLEFQK